MNFTRNVVVSRTAEQTKRDNAIGRLRKGFGIADVSECVDLPEDEVRRLVEEMRCIAQG